MARINKLLQPEHSNRCTGRTTAIALDLIARCVHSQGTPCYAEDHQGNSTSAALVLRDRVGSIARALGLQHFEVTVVQSQDQYHGHVRAISNIWQEV